MPTCWARSIRVRSTSRSAVERGRAWTKRASIFSDVDRRGRAASGRRDPAPEAAQHGPDPERLHGIEAPGRLGLRERLLGNLDDQARLRCPGRAPRCAASVPSQSGSRRVDPAIGRTMRSSGRRARWSATSSRARASTSVASPSRAAAAARSPGSARRPSSPAIPAIAVAKAGSRRAAVDGAAGRAGEPAGVEGVQDVRRARARRCARSGAADPPRRRRSGPGCGERLFGAPQEVGGVACRGPGAVRRRGGAGSARSRRLRRARRRAGRRSPPRRPGRRPAPGRSGSLAIGDEAVAPPHDRADALAHPRHGAGRVLGLERRRPASGRAAIAAPPRRRPRSRARSGRAGPEAGMEAVRSAGPGSTRRRPARERRPAAQIREPAARYPPP